MKSFVKKITALELAKALGWELSGENIQISNVASLSEMNSESISFSTKELPATEIKGCIISKQDKTGFKVENPRLAFTRALTYLTQNGFLNNKGERHDIHPTVQIAKSATVEDGVVIGENTLICENVVIRSNVVIGKNCIVGPNSVIGNRGFGYERDEQGRPQHMPHVGGVIIGDHVDIGALTTVISGTLSPTIVGNYTKIDDHVHFGHNCIVGESAILTACSEYSGGVKIGDQVWIGPNVSIKEKLKIGEKSFAGIGAVILKDVPANTVVVGNPARPLQK